MIQRKFLSAAHLFVVACTFIVNPAISAEILILNRGATAKDMVDVLLGTEAADPEYSGSGSSTGAPTLPLGAEVNGSPDQSKDNILDLAETFEAGEHASDNRNIIGYRIEFSFNSAEVAESDYGFLDEVASMMKLERMRGHVLVVEGHTDSKGTAEYNVSLSKQRASAVVRYLVEKHDISASVLEYVGKGESEPLDGTDPEDGSNRRVQFYLM